MTSRAVAYVRMSSDRQELSIGTQLAAIQAYAEVQELELVRIYEDSAKSGLNIANREGMKSLLRDVLDTPRPFDVVLVYDVSRWGRFQDIDAAAYYEYTCRLHGAKVIYVEEAFGTDEEPMTALLKTLKRAMAAEYSRDLSVKSRAGQDRAVHLGYQMGQLPCIGLTRIAIDRLGNRRPLARGQCKAMQSERIAWVPGPPDEVELTRRIFSLYADHNGSIKGVAQQLRMEGKVGQDGRPFTTTRVDNLLRCEALAGNFVWGSERYAAGPAKKRRPPTRADNVIEPVIPADLWKRTQERLWVRRRLRRDKEQMIQVLRERLAENPGLNCLDLEAMGIRSTRAYTNAFGSVSRALELAGRDPRVVRAQHERQKLVGRRVGDRIGRDLAELMQANGLKCRQHPRSRVLVFNEAVRMRLQVLWPRINRGVRRWHVLKARRPIADLVLLAQMDDEDHAMRFVLLDRTEYRNTTPWLDEELPPYLTPITTGQSLVQAMRDRLASISPVA
ncbi:MULTISPECIES: recombinase family protein [unclassified Hydrogenophaga]|uniref:recombinase family protein n=1 Tax=unclassified Hydrogenophaga TaxID=2610897 RepID=UPI000B213528|nr:MULTISPECIES: recombinase family protein [unclassified Hydrogenophaga]MBN9370587.1 recombinase family protein [Hydrogenophaga sp.]